MSEGSAHGGRAAAHAAGRDIPVPAEPAIDVARLRVAIARLSRRLRRHELAGLTPTQLSALATVERAGPLRLGDLAAAEGIAPSTLTRLVTALEERAYVTRCPVPGDARASTLSITASGHDVLDQIRHSSTLMLADSLRTLPADQLVALAAALPALEQLADADAGSAGGGANGPGTAGTGGGAGSGGTAGTGGTAGSGQARVPRAAGV